MNPTCNSDFPTSVPVYDNGKAYRSCQRFCIRHQLTKKQHAKNWLGYSESKEILFSFMYKLITSGEIGRFVKEGLLTGKVHVILVSARRKFYG